jgi:TolB protein
VKNIETGELTLLGSGYQPKFSPDGKTIAYVKYATDVKSSSIWTMDLEGTNQVQITDAKKGYALNPAWSPDEKKMLIFILLTLMEKI